MSDGSGTRREDEPPPGGSSPGAGSTRREGGDFAGAGFARGTGTRREVPAGGVNHQPATRREHEDPTTGQAHYYGETVLLPSLQSRFRFVDEPRSGNEAQVLQAIDRTTGATVLVKQYMKGIAPDLDALQRIRDLDSPHVVSLIEFGTDEGSERFYEIQEWIDGNDLRDELQERDLSSDVEEVIRQITAGLDEYHAADLLHRDIKPSNIMVANSEPLRLVLADFGLARTLRGTKRMTTVAGTIEYRAPETIYSSGFEVANRPSLDWWSLGIIAAEVHLGESFFALPDGTNRSEAEIQAIVRDRELEFAKLDSVESLQHLCRGLLTYDSDHRWSARQVNCWLEDPDDPELSIVAESASTVRRRTVHFHGEQSSPSDLATALQEHWDEAVEQLFRDRSERLVDEVGAMADEYQLDGVAEAFDGGSGATASERAQQTGNRRLASLLAALDPALTPVYRGIDLRPEAIHRLASPDRSEILDELHDEEILLVWRRLPGMHRAGEIHDRWRGICDRIGQRVSALSHLSDSQRTDAVAHARAIALAFAVDERRAGRTVRRQMLGRRRLNANRDQSWKRLARRGAPPEDLALARASMSAVIEQSTTDLQPSSPLWTPPNRRRPPASERTATGLGEWARSSAVAVAACTALLVLMRSRQYPVFTDDKVRSSLWLVGAVLAVTIALVAAARRRVGHRLVWVALAAGVALVWQPDIFDGFFSDGTEIDRYVGGIMLLPVIALIAELAFALLSGAFTRLLIIAAAVAGFGLVLGTPIERVLTELEPAGPETSQRSSPTSTGTTANDPSTSTNREPGEPCFLAQLATLPTRARANEIAAEINDRAVPPVTVGLSEWLPDWTSGRHVVFRSFDTEAEAAAYLADLGTARSGGIVVHIADGGPACG